MGGIIKLIIEGIGDYCAITNILCGRLAVVSIGSVVFWLILAVRLAGIALSRAVSTQMVTDKCDRYCLSGVLRGVATMESTNAAPAGHSRYGDFVYCQLPRYVMAES